MHNFYHRPIYFSYIIYTKYIQPSYISLFQDIWDWPCFAVVACWTSVRYPHPLWPECSFVQTGCRSCLSALRALPKIRRFRKIVAIQPLLSH